MLASRALLGAVAALAGFASAANLTESEMERLMAARAAYPKCALECMQKLIPESACTETDIACLCTNEALNGQIGACALGGCTLFEGLTTKNVSMTMCGAPIRDKSALPLYIGLVFGGLALLAFILRACFWVVQHGRKMGWDDYFAILAVLCAGPPTAFAVTLTNNGLGKDMWTLSLQNIKNILQYYYLGSIFYFASIMVTKLSILCFMLRVFPEPRFRMIVYGVCGLVAGYGIAFIVATALQCWPVQYAWEQVDESWGTGTCNNIHIQGWMSAIFNIILDIIMLVLPLKKLWSLQMKLKKKLMIMFMFSLGMFATAISVARLQTLVLFANSQNIPWDYTDAAWFSTLEIHVGIICASLPAVRQLLINMGAGGLRSTLNRSQGSNMYGSGHLGHRSAASGGFPADDKTPAQQTPKHGDEHDFVPLVEYPGHKGYKKSSGYSYSVNSARPQDSESV